MEVYTQLQNDSLESFQSSQLLLTVGKKEWGGERSFFLNTKAGHYINFNKLFNHTFSESLSLNFAHTSKFRFLAFRDGSISSWWSKYAALILQVSVCTQENSRLDNFTDDTKLVKHPNKPHCMFFCWTWQERLRYFPFLYMMGTVPGIPHR